MEQVPDDTPQGIASTNPPSPARHFHPIAWRWFREWLAPVLLASVVLILGIVVLVNLLSSDLFS